MNPSKLDHDFPNIPYAILRTRKSIDIFNGSFLQSFKAVTWRHQKVQLDFQELSEAGVTARLWRWSHVLYTLSIALAAGH